VVSAQPMTLGNMRALTGGGQYTDVRPNWKEQQPRPSLTGKEWR